MEKITLSKILKLLDWEEYSGIYLSIDRSPAEWISATNLRNKFDWSKYEVVKITRKFIYSYEDKDYLLLVKTIGDGRKIENKREI